MFLPCPNCGFLVALIVSVDGVTQRCPRCHEPLQSPTDVEPDETSSAATPAEAASTSESIAAATTPSAASPDAPQIIATEPPAVPTTAAEPPPTPTPAPATRRAGRKLGSPSFARVPVTRGVHRSRWPELAMMAALSVLLTLQLLLAQRAELASDARWRSSIVALCGVLQCEVPPWREPTAFTMLSRSVQPRPGQAGVLEVDASFRNDARWPQPWPTLVLSLADIDGNPVGARAFTPNEYRPGGGNGTLAPGQSASVQFEVVEPSPRIVAFTFEFR